MSTSTELSDRHPARAFFSEIGRIALLALVIIVPTRLFLAEPFVVSGSSMFPTYHDRQYLIVNKLGYRFSKPQRGDVIIFRYPKNESQFFIKRVIGLPGEQVRLSGGRVIITNADYPNGQVLDEPYLKPQDITFGSNEAVTLGSGEYFVLGDNRQASSDSRVWGVLPERDIIGESLFRIFPLTDFGPVNDLTPTFTAN